MGEVALVFLMYSPTTHSEPRAAERQGTICKAIRTISHGLKIKDGWNEAHAVAVSLFFTRPWVMIYFRKFGVQSRGIVSRHVFSGAGSIPFGGRSIE